MGRRWLQHVAVWPPIGGVYLFQYPQWVVGGCNQLTPAPRPALNWAFQYPQWVVGGCNLHLPMYPTDFAVFQYPQWVVGGCN